MHVSKKKTIRKAVALLYHIKLIATQHLQGHICNTRVRKSRHKCVIKRNIKCDKP